MATPVSETSIRVNLPFEKAVDIIDNLLEQVNMRRILPVDKLSENFYSVEILVRRGFLRGVKREKVTIVKRVSSQADAKTYTYQDVDNKMTLTIRLRREGEDTTRVEVVCTAEKSLRDLCSKLAETATTLLSEEAARLTVQRREPARPAPARTEPARPTRPAAATAAAPPRQQTPSAEINEILDDPASLAIRILRAEILHRTNLPPTIRSDDLIAQIKEVMDKTGANTVFATLSGGAKTLVIVASRDGQIHAAVHEIDKATRISLDKLDDAIAEITRNTSQPRLTIYKL